MGLSRHNGAQREGVRISAVRTDLRVTPLASKLTDFERDWYLDAIDAFQGSAVSLDRSSRIVTYDSTISSDESHARTAEGEELVHAVIMGLLHSSEYNYPLTALGHEMHYAHGSKGSKSDEVDVLIRDPDGLPYAVVEIKPAADFESGKSDAIKNQLFGTAPLVGSPTLLVYATVDAKGKKPSIRCIRIDYTRHKTYAAWQADGEPHSTVLPIEYQDLDYKPFISGGTPDLAMDSTQADFRAVALSFHNEFFGEHADNTLFVNLVKCLLAKIHDERTCKNGDPYEFQVKYRNGKPDNAADLFARVNKLYRAAYTRYIDSKATEVDEINPKEFSEERVKTVVLALQAISITKGAAKHGDIIGTFFEEILRTGFKQDRGMYFTHDNIVRFIVEAVDLVGLTKEIWQSSNHPDNRLPYIMDPACGSGTFLLHGMGIITSAVKSGADSLVNDHDSEQFYKARMSDQQPNYWAENFVYGFDPKFIMAITAKVNMVLHGDGSAHIFKDDAFRPLTSYTDVRLRPCPESQRSVSKSQYPRAVCEAFDVIVSNPPFGITIASDTKAKVPTTFLLPDTTPSEGLFLERCYQLLKAGGRLGIVLPESLLNAKEMAAVRLFIYRFFHIRSIVALPRNIFIDTPTLTSLVFAQKKNGQEVTRWDAEWDAAFADSEARIKLASQSLGTSNAKSKDALTIAAEFLAAASPVITGQDWVLKGGKSPAVLRVARRWTNEPGTEAAAHFREILRTSGFEALRQRYVLSKVAETLDYSFPSFEVSEVGYKLSKRKERARSNELLRFRTSSGADVTNLHLTDEPCTVETNIASPTTVLDHIRAAVKWA